jgi:hypothetical protein
MKTRTLLLLALACGVAIMLSGAVLLFQLSAQDEPDPATELGVEATAGDMTIVVAESAESAGTLRVTVRIGGVDDPDGAAGFRLIAAGRPIAPEAGDGTCAATTVAAGTCELRFDVAAADGASRVLFYDRGDDSVRWVLA